MGLRTLLIAAVVLSADTAQADLITPGSISPAPAGWVTDEYKRLGVVFAPPSPSSPVGTYSFFGGGWNSLSAWWQRGPDGVPLGPPTPGVPAGYQSIGFVMPGTGAPATTDSIRVQFFSPGDAVITLKGYDLAGHPIGSQAMLVGTSSDNWLTLRASGMHSFEILSDWAPGAPLPLNNPNFVMEAIEFHPAPAAPEPGSLTLFAMGSLVMAGRVWVRHKRRLTDPGYRSLARFMN